MRTKSAVLSIFLMGSADSLWAGDECQVHEQMFDAPSAEVEKRSELFDVHPLCQTSCQYVLAKPHASYLERFREKGVKPISY